MRHLSAITETDLGECYDKMAHPPTSIEMQSWGYVVRLKTVNNLANPPHEVVAETPAGVEDNGYPSHVKIPQPNGINLQIRTHELEDAERYLLQPLP